MELQQIQKHEMNKNREVIAVHFMYHRVDLCISNYNWKNNVFCIKIEKLLRLCYVLLIIAAPKKRIEKIFKRTLKNFNS